MNLHKLRKREELKNRLEFPLKCAEYNIKLSFDNKKEECKEIYKTVANKIKLEYNKNKIKNNHLIEYIYNIDNRIINPKPNSNDNKILEVIKNNYDLIKEFQESKGRLLIEEKEKLEDKVATLFRKEEKKENKKLKKATDEIMYGFDIYNKLKDDFLESNYDFNHPLNDIDNLIQEKRVLKTELEIIKNINVKLKEMLKNQKKIYKKLKLEESCKKEETKELHKKDEDNKNKIKNEESIVSDKSNKSIKIIKNNFLRNNKNYHTNYYDLFNSNNYRKNKYNKKLILKNVSKYKNNNSLRKHLFSYDSNSTKKVKKCKRPKLVKNLSTRILSNIKNLMIQTNFTNSPMSSLTPKSMHKSTTTTRLFSAGSNFHSSYNSNNNSNSKIQFIYNNNKDDEKDDSNEKKYLMSIVDYLKEQIEMNNDCTMIINALISEEIKTMIWVKDFIEKSIRDLRYDINDLNVNIKHNKKINAKNKNLEIELKKNENLLFFCTFVYDNCLKGNNKTTYILNDNKNNKSQKNLHRLFVTERK